MTDPARPATPPDPAARQMTAAELASYRHQLKQAIAFFDRQDPVPPARADLQARLVAITAGQAARTGELPAGGVPAHRRE
jgi:hypothetical protein